jgi:hypothetical protein
MAAPAVRGFTVMKHLTALGAITGAAALALTGCGDQTPKKVTPSASGTVKAPLYDELPASVRQAGVVKVGSDMLYPPMEFVRNGKPVGVDPDLATVMGRELGVRFEFANGAFDTLLTGLRAKHYDAVMSAMSDTKDRQEGLDPSTGEKIGEGIDFVDYFTSGSSIMVKKGNPEGVGSPADLCGKKAAVPHVLAGQHRSPRQPHQRIRLQPGRRAGCRVVLRGPGQARRMDPPRFLAGCPGLRAGGECEPLRSRAGAEGSPSGRFVVALTASRVISSRCRISASRGRRPLGR